MWARAVLAWLKRHRGLVAVVVAVVVVARLLRNTAAFAWTFREVIPWDDVRPWLEDHWPLLVAGAAVLFAAVFFVVRAVAGWAGERWGKPSEEATATAPAPPADTAPTPSSGLTAGDPLEKG